MPDRIIINSTGCGHYSSKTAGSSFFLKVKNSLYQFEADEGISSVINKSKLDINSIRSIFISHLHPDHIAGLFIELQSMYLTDRIQPISLYIPEEGIFSLEDFLDTLYLFNEKFQFDLEIKPIESGVFFTNDDISVSAIKNKHLEKNRQLIEKYRKLNRCQSYSFVIGRDDKRIFYTGDITSIDELRANLDNTDIVISELSHVEPYELIKLCGEMGADKLIFIHFMEDVAVDQDDLRSHSKKYGLNEIYVAHEGMIINI